MEIKKNEDGSVTLIGMSDEEEAIVNMLSAVASGGGYTQMHSATVTDQDTVSAIIVSKAPCYTHFEDGVPRNLGKINPEYYRVLSDARQTIDHHNQRHF